MISFSVLSRLERALTIKALLQFLPAGFTWIEIIVRSQAGNSEMMTAMSSIITER
jgi:hypothetical protein